jgi:hypothetical protein
VLEVEAELRRFVEFLEDAHPGVDDFRPDSIARDYRYFPCGHDGRDYIDGSRQRSVTERSAVRALPTGAVRRFPIVRQRDDRGPPAGGHGPRRWLA